jgi:hypothetical protein
MVLAYLDALLDAISLRDTAEVERLLAHPLARILPDVARDEARVIGRGEGDALAAPLHVMRLRHLTAELLREEPVVADRAVVETVPVADAPRESVRSAPARPHRTPRLVQMELPLSA